MPRRLSLVYKFKVGYEIYGGVTLLMKFERSMHRYMGFGNRCKGSSLLTEYENILSSSNFRLNFELML